MKTFKQLMSENKVQYSHMYIDESLHPDLQAVLDKSSSRNRLASFSSAIRKKIKAGESTGLESDKPKKGSSRAVYFPKEPHKITLDGKEAHVHSVVKVAFHGTLDHHNKSGMLLGEHQNLAEADHFGNRHYGILSSNSDGTYTTNHESGVTAPVFDSHTDGHYLHMGRVRPFKNGEFRKLTTTHDFPKGISHEEFFHTLMHHHEESQGRTHWQTPKNVDKLSDHPFIKKTLDFVQTMGQHPGDYNKRNLGVFEHPDGSHHPVISDFGFSHSVAKEYHAARQNMIKARHSRY
jgi:hypothetical protein